jgi:integrase
LPTPEDKRAIFYDAHLPGLCLHVQPSGHRAFGWYRKVRAVPTFRSIGVWPETSVQQARDTAERWNGELKDWKANRYQGPNPFAKEMPVEPASTPTFREMCEAYITRHVRENANRPEKAEYNARWLLKKHFAGWLDKRIDGITVENVLSVKNACGKHRHQANRCTEFARTVYNWAARAKDGKTNFWPVANPARDVSFFEEKPRERFLQPQELAAFNETLKKEVHRDLADFLTLAITTGARRSDIFSMQWADLQWEREVWRVPYPKNGEAYDVSLLPAALEVLKRRHAERTEGEGFVFSGVGKSGHLTDLKKQWQEFRKAARIPDVRLHDLRRTVGSYLAMAGTNLPTIAASLGHRSLQSVAIYARLHDASVREAREFGQKKMLAMMNASKKRAKLTVRKQKLLTAVARG